MSIRGCSCSAVAKILIVKYSEAVEIFGTHKCTIVEFYDEYKIYKLKFPRYSSPEIRDRAVNSTYYYLYVV